MILMVVAIVCGLGASYMTSRLLAEREEQPQQQQPPPEAPKVKILVAKSQLDVGSAIKEPQAMFREKSVPQEDVPKDALTEFKQLKGKFLKNGLRKDDVVTNEDLMDERASILARLPDGFRAYGIQVDPQSIAAGFAAVPGSKVDILFTMKRGDDKSSFSKILLEDVLVLAGDTNSKPLDEGKALPSNVVTVALKIGDTMKVKMAQQYGQLTLTLRKHGDVTPLPDKFVRGEDLFNEENDGPKNKPRKTGDSEVPQFETDPDTGLPILPPNQGDTKPIQNDTKPVTGDPRPTPIQVEPKKGDQVAVQRVAPPKRYFHRVTIRMGDKETKQLIEVDANGVPIQDDVQGAPNDVAPALQPVNPSVEAPNGPTPDQPANNEKETRKGSNKN
jgi:pilus assembly protein CpaB